MQRKQKRVALLAATLVFAGASTSPGHAATSPVIAVDTTNRTVASALTDIARRSGRELLLATPSIGAVRAPLLRGRFTIDQVMPLLLAGSGLAFRRAPDGAYVIYVAPAIPPPEPDIPVALPELLVTSRSHDSDIRRTENDIQAYKVWSSGDIEQAHSADLNEFLRVMSTGDAQIASALQDPTNTSASTRSEVNLRGMGSAQTLILVDGRRMPGLPPASLAGVVVMGQADINGLPLAAIDRIEVLNTSAGGIYGAGATAGAVNIVLKRDYQGADLGVTYGVTARGDAPTRRLDGRIGFSFGEGRTQAAIAFGLLRAGGLSDGDRDYEARARARRFSNDPGRLAIERPIGDSITVLSASGAPLSLDPAYGGAGLGATKTFAPLSSSGITADLGAVLLANAGRTDSRLSPDAAGANRALLSDREISSLVASLRHRLSRSIELYGDLLLLRNEGQSVVTEGFSGGAVLSAEASTNPFQQDIVALFPLLGLDPKSRNVTRTRRGSAGLIMDLPRDWKFNLDYSRGEARIDVTLDQTFLKPEFRTALQTGTIDVFGGRDALRGDLVRFGVQDHLAFSQTNQFRDGSLRLAGPILDLGGGPMTLTLTAEERRERVPASILSVPAFGLPAPIVVALRGIQQSARYYYGELRAPVTDRYDGPRGLKGLEFQIALRHETLKERPPIDPPSLAPIGLGTPRASQSTTMYTAGFKVYPADWLMARASFASGVLPPAAGQIGPSTTQYTTDPAIYASLTGLKVLRTPETSPVDSRRNNERLGISGAYSVISGGSPDLKAERARSLSAGVVLTPLRHLRMSLDYTRIDKHQEIVRFHNGEASYFLQNETLYPGRVVRAPLTDADRAKGYSVGAIVAIDTTGFNIGRTLVEAIDLQADYLIPTEHLGDFRLRAAGTWQPKLRRKSDPESAAVEYVGYADGPLEWRANGGADWSKGATTVGFNVSVYDGYRVFNRLDAADLIANLTLWQGTSRIPVQAYFDLFASQKIIFGGAVGDMRDIQLRLGLQNVFDHSPPVIAQPVGFNLTTFNYSTYGDPRRRRLEVSLMARF